MHDRDAAALDQMHDIIGQTLRGLRTLQRKQMLHQHLKPENATIDADGTMQIIDLDSTSVAGLQDASPNPHEGILSTLQYTVSEYFVGLTPSWRSDQFSLAVVVYPVLTGRLAF